MLHVIIYMLNNVKVSAEIYLIFCSRGLNIYEGLDGGSGIH